MKPCPIRLLSLSSFILSVFLAPAPAFGFLDRVLGSDTKTTNESARASAGSGDYKGVKHAIGVTDFSNESGWAGQWELGENLAMMLESALFDCGRFVVVDRQQLDATLVEQDLQASGRAAAASRTAQTGLVRSARYLATGSVTRADQSTGGNTGGVSVRGFRVGGGSDRAEVELVVRLVDTTSGEVVASQRVSGVAGGQRLNLGYSRRGFSGDLGGFARTPIGEAAQDCIVKAVDFIAKEMEDYAITASIVMASAENQIVINRGEEFGVTTGQEFLIREEGELLTDPETGAILAVFEGEVTGRIRVTRVAEKVAYCELVEGPLPARGDVVIFGGI